MQTLEQLEEKYKELGEEIEKFKQEQSKPKTGRWKPRYGDKYFYFSNNGFVYEAWTDHSLDEHRYVLGNCFQTKKEAEFQAERLKVIAELKEYASEFVEGEENWGIYWSYYQEHIEYDWRTIDKYPVLYFPSKEVVRQAIEAVGEERVKKYYLGVE